MANVLSYGFIGLADLYNQRVNQVGVERIWDAIQMTTEEYTRVINEIMAEFAMRTEVAQEQIELPGSGTLQPLDEDGNPIPVAPSGYYQVAYPIKGAGTAWGNNRVSRALMTVEEADRNTDDATQKDADWLFRHCLAGVFDNVAWTFNDKVGPNGSKGLGDISIQPLANGDAVVYGRKGLTAPAVDDHYLAQAAAISDSANPFPTIYSELTEHPSNTGRVVSYISTSLKATVTALAGFTEVTPDDLIPGGNTDTVTNIPSAGPGDKVLGYVDDCWVVEWSKLPSGYMLAKMEGAPFMKMREYPAPELKGFFTENHSPDGNHIVNRFLRYTGFGVYDRVAAVVYYVGGASYVIPTGYDAPLAV